MKNLLLGLTIVGLTIGGIAAQVELHFFGAVACLDCYVMKAFLAKLAQEYPKLIIIEHEVTLEPDNWRLMVTLAQAYGLKEEKVPTVFVGDLAITGVGRPVELQIREEVERCIAQGCPSPLARLPPTRAAVLSPLEKAVLLIILGIVVVALYLLSQ